MAAEGYVATKRTRRRRRRRRVLLTLVLVPLLAAAVGAYGLGHLGAWPFRGFVTGLARDEAGLALSYARLGVGVLGGAVEADDLVLLNPERFAEVAPSFVSVRRVRGTLDVSALLAGEVHLEQARLEGVRITLATDEAGDALDALFPSDPDDETPPSALSATLAGLDGLGVFAEDSTIEDVTLELVSAEEGRVVRRLAIEDLRLAGRFDARDTAEAALTLGDTPATFVMESAGADPLRLVVTPAAEATLESGTLALTLATRAHEATGLPPGVTLPDGPLLTGRVEARFDAESARTELRVDTLRLLGDVAALDASATLRDERDDTLERLTGVLVLDVPDTGALPVPLGDLEARELALTARVEDGTLGPERFSLPGTAQMRAASLRLPGELLGSAEELVLTGADATLESQLEGEGDALRTLALTADAELATLRYAAPAGVDAPDAVDLALTGARLSYRGSGLNFGPGPAPDAPEGDALELTLARLALDDGAGTRLDAEEAALRATGEPGQTPLLQALLDGAPLTGTLALPARAFTVALGPRDRIALGNADLQLAMRALELEGPGLAGLGGATTATLRARTLEGRLGGTPVRGRELAPRVDVDFDTEAYAGTLPFASLGYGTLRLAGSRLSLDGEAPLALDPAAPGDARLQLRGSLGRVSDGEDTARLPALAISVRKSGSGRLVLDGRLTTADVRAAGASFEEPRQATLAGTVNLRALAADLRLGLDGETGPTLDVHAVVSSEGRVLRHRVEGEGTQLRGLFTGPLRGLLPAGTSLDLDAFRVATEGTFAGVLRNRAVPPALTADPLASADGEGTLTLSVDGLRAAQDGLEAQADGLALSGALRASAGDLAVEAELTSDALGARDGPLSVLLRGVRQELRVTGTGVSDARIAATLRVADGTQTAAPGYALRDLSAEAEVRTSPEALVLDRFELSNAGGDTELSATGTYEQLVSPEDDARGPVRDRVPGREALTVAGELRQGLAVLVPLGLADEASGTLGLPFRLQSGDLVTFRTEARLEPEDVDLSSGDLEVRGLTGIVPIREDITVLRGGRVAIDAGAGGNVLARTRFPDVQPFLAAQDFVRMDTLRVGEEQLGPLAGNLSVDGLELGLDRLQVGWRGGVLDGRVDADFTPGRGRVAFRGNVTGLRPDGGDDVLDANLALTLVPSEYALDGTVQVLRVGKAHLGQILDALDPYEEDPDMNSLRLALRVGYPESMRLRAREGLLDVRVSLGGVARLVRVEDILGIPLTPLLEPELRPLVEELEALLAAAQGVAAAGEGAQP
ncbi:MAG: hypothetical protein AAF447_20255 [Myxococcota bacterium]